MQDHATHRNQHPGAQFQQPFAQGPDLSAGTVGARGPQAQLLHQHVSGGGQQHPELVGPEIAATGAVDLQVVQFLDPVLDFAALAVNLFVDPLRTLLQVGDDEARIVFRCFAVGTDDLGLDDDAALSRPALGA